MANIKRFEKNSFGEWIEQETFSSDSPYWKIENDVVFYIFWEVMRGKYKEISRSAVCMSEKEAEKNNCHCFYSIA